MEGREHGHDGEQGAVAVELGSRLRNLRTTAGLTQTELAGGRFSKEYLSQIERGKTRPTTDTVAWLAERLGVDADLLLTGVSASERNRWEAQLARAEALCEQYEFAAAAPEFAEARTLARAAGAKELELRALTGEGWARLQEGELKDAAALLTEARTLSEDARFSDIERADVLFRLGACRYQLSSISTAIGLFDAALELADRSQLPNDLLRAQIFRWRSRCYRRQRDWQAAREDVERALELAEGLSDRRAAAQVYFQASLVAEREGHWVLARSYAERARAYYEELADRENVGRLLNNLGGLTYLLGKPDQAIEVPPGLAPRPPRRGHRRGGGARHHVTRGDLRRHGPARRSGDAGAQGARDARHALRLPLRDRNGAAHAGTRPARAGSSRRG